jgi:hypothetical protein
MASPVQCIVESQLLPNSPTVLYTAPAGTYAQIVKCSYVNTDSASRTVTSYIGPSATAASTITDAQAVLPGQTFNSPNEYAHVLNPGDSLWAMASVASVVAVRVSALLAT